MMSKKIPAGLALCCLLLNGCSLFSDSRSTEYQSQSAAAKSQPLEVPPDLTAPVADDRYLIPDGKATTYSAYTKDRATPQAPVETRILPRSDIARIERAGDQRWLVVDQAPDKVWPVVKDFWTDLGFVLKREVPETGVMETDWAENRSKIPQDIIRNSIGKLLDGLYSTGERDKFFTRLEKGARENTTEVYISHRGLEEAGNTQIDKANVDATNTGWRVRGTDRNLEAEMLSRLLLRFGYKGDKTAALAATVNAVEAPSKATYDKSSGEPLKVLEPFDRAWRRIGLALDRSGFTVEDRDRSKGLFFVRYIDPDTEARSSEKGFLDKLAFWRKDEPLAKPQYRIFVEEKSGVTQVVVQNIDGTANETATAVRILSLLHAQLK